MEQTTFPNSRLPTGPRVPSFSGFLFNKPFSYPRPLRRLLRPTRVDYSAISGASVDPGDHQPGAQPIGSTFRDHGDGRQASGETPSGVDWSSVKTSRSRFRGRAGRRHRVTAHRIQKQSQVPLYRVNTQDHCHRKQIEVNIVLVLLIQ